MNKIYALISGGLLVFLLLISPVNAVSKNDGNWSFQFTSGNATVTVNVIKKEIKKDTISWQVLLDQGSGPQQYAVGTSNAKGTNGTWRVLSPQPVPEKLKKSKPAKK
ncbi:MAG: hypothetical protein DKM50_03490 [Candidatus Margulisiibacteriota bacterium]|nr:MAG: hypothetical protein A2X42_02135 [Candidatus Margulisbacteria bacterium GWF2_38_17]OGI09633.1 MAG: hypothetical protein A2X41_04845 [Candidatus Margulisbacteria bacterium GWE2_39_32]PZM83041.1 MAG: hypothetical protein DKM50_03490 [Candidatus Margulisiibacteriota bacterium]HCT86468.1 hypothetical protein [Candidatus Margulisiibacteriota bacterium]HCY35956.1 hypothetical protein [Candidatus Margulisiibacteriota bacterium]